jgi:hypothetical protein
MECRSGAADRDIGGREDMKRIWLYYIILMLGIPGCKDSDWTGGDSGTEGLKKVKVEMAVESGVSFEEYIHSLAVYAFQQMDNGSFVYYRKVADLSAEDIHNLESGMLAGEDSKMLKLTLPAGLYRFYYLANDLTGEYVEPPRGGSVEQGYLPFPPTGLEQAYFMGEVEMKPRASDGNPLFVILGRVVSRLTVVVTDVPESIDTVRYRLNGIASRLLLTEKTSGDTASCTGIYPRRVFATADTVISRLLLFPSAWAVLALQFTSDGTVVKEKSIPLSGLIPDNDVVITGHWDETGVTTLSRTSATPFCSSSRSGD